MTGLLSIMTADAVQDIGWTLMHFLWQGLFLAALLNAILPLCRSAMARHNWALGTLATMGLAPVATFLFFHDFANAGQSALAAASTTGLFAPASLSLPWIGWVVAFWLAGIAALSLRALGGWYVAGSLARRDTLALPADLLQRCHVLQRRLAVTGPVRFLLSRRVRVPVVIGWLRPLVLIPVAALAGLAPQQLDALILHELAHIRRLDTLANILLIAVETILFYHPAVWWVSRKIRSEREHCCDDYAVAACGDAALYVEALTSLADGKMAGLPVLAANGGSLKTRAARLLEPAGPRRFSFSAMAGLTFLGLVAASVAMAQTPGAVMLRPIMATHTLPPYPVQSVHLKEQGRVTLAVTIGKDGGVSRALVAKSSGHPRLDTAAAAFVKDHYRWQPPVRNGKPVTTATRVAVLFQLRAQPKAAAPH